MTNFLIVDCDTTRLSRSDITQVILNAQKLRLRGQDQQYIDASPVWYITLYSRDSDMSLE